MQSSVLISSQCHADLSSRTPPVSVAGTETANLIAMFSSIIIILCILSSVVFLSVGCACGWFGLKHRQSRASKAISDSAEKNTCHLQGTEQSQLPQNPGPLYEELQQEHQDLVELKENVAYGPIIAR